ncbi:MAG TPA: carboxypeptidase-like regulatory domain-containing protein [Gemmatimonadaceae bacterium]|nr:carboxypeptidase-like regulatory domain-containing protein [Gemmatimonadaceae bacterium]
MRFTVLVGCIAVAAAASTVQAQSFVRGVVRAESTLRSVGGAEITIADLRRVARSNSTGRYFFDSIPPGSHQIAVRALGYEPLVASLTIDPAEAPDTADVDFLLKPSAIELKTVTVEAKSTPIPNGKMADFERRRRVGVGQFLQREQLQKNQDTPLSITLRTLLAVRLVVRPWQCGGGYAAASGRGEGGFGGGGQQLVCGQLRFPPACYVAVYIDGARVWAWDTPEPPNVDDLLAAELEGIELYRGASELPPELLATGNQCGALLLWSRVG